MRFKTKLLLSLSFILIIIFLIIPKMGLFLVKNDAKYHVDAIVVLMGNIPDRILEARDLFQKGFSDTILIVMANRYGIDFLRKTGVNIDGQTLIAKKALIQLGVPKGKIIIIPGDAKSTYEEALSVSKYLDSCCKIDTLMIVSSNLHMRRAWLLFNHVLNNERRRVVLLSCPSKYTGLDAKHWWKKRESRKGVFLEYLKLLNFYLFDKNHYQVN